MLLQVRLRFKGESLAECVLQLEVNVRKQRTLVFYPFMSSEHVADVVQERKCEDCAVCHKVQTTYLFQFRSPVK